jgi:hypothetical protein
MMIHGYNINFRYVDKKYIKQPPAHKCYNNLE